MDIKQSVTPLLCGNWVLSFFLAPPVTECNSQTKSNPVHANEFHVGEVAFALTVGSWLLYMKKILKEMPI